MKTNINHFNTIQSNENFRTHRNLYKIFYLNISTSKSVSILPPQNLDQICEKLDRFFFNILMMENT